MIEITNHNRFPVQVIVKKRGRPRAFTTLNIPGMGKGKNVYYLDDQRSTEYIERVEAKFGLITTRYIPDNEVKNKGE